MTETLTAGAAAAAADLRAHGHRVAVCHPDGTEACVRLNGGRCPLDRGTIDAVVVVRTAATSEALPLERGAWCALQHGVPLVVAGQPDDNPFAEWAAFEEEGSEVARTVETVGGLPVPVLSAIATRALHEALVNGAVPHQRTRVEVHRRHGGAVAHLLGTAGLSSARAAMASVRVAAALRAADPWLRRIDVTRSDLSSAAAAAPAPATASPTA